MTDLEQIVLRDVRRLDLRPGETLVITLSRELNWDHVMAVIEKVKEWFPESHVLALPAGSKIEVVQPAGKEASTGEGRPAEEA